MSSISFLVLLLISKNAILVAYLAYCSSHWHPEPWWSGLSHHLPFSIVASFPPILAIPNASAFPPEMRLLLLQPRWSFSVFRKKEGLVPAQGSRPSVRVSPLLPVQLRYRPSSHSQDSNGITTDPAPLLCWLVTLGMFCLPIFLIFRQRKLEALPF